MAVTKTNLEYPTRSELDDQLQDFQSLVWNDSSPLWLWDLASQVRGYERLKSRKARQTPSALQAYMFLFLHALSDAISGPISDIPGKYKILIKFFEEKCYQPAPADRRLKEGELKEWPFVRSDDLLAAFIISAGILDFLDRCFDRSASDPKGRQESIPSLNDLHAKFQVEYQGTAVQELRESLNRLHANYDHSVHYGRIIPIVNSSGLGKSKLVFELGKQDLLLSICFRKDEGPEAGWPPGDRGATRFFDTTSKSDDMNSVRAEERSAAFYGALCSVIADNLPRALSPEQRGVLNAARNHTADEPDEPHAVASQLMEKWKIIPDTDGVSSRAQLFFQVEEEAKRSLLRYLPTLKDMRHNGDTVDPVGWYLALFDLFVAEPLSRLCDAVKRLSFDRFFFAFDECGYLNQGGSPQIPERMSLIALLRIIKAADGRQAPLTLWHFLLDTSSHIAELARQGRDTPSARLPRGHEMLPIWPYLTFDAMLSSRPRARVARDTLKVVNYSYYGRPLWSTLLGHDLVNVATRKLFCEPFDPSQKMHAFAAFAQRVLLELVHSDVASSIAADAVQKHMRILVFAGKEFISTYCPSEPALAVAAACALLRNNNNYRAAFQTLFTDLVLRGIIQDRGASGGLCTRLLLLIARDYATVPDKSPLGGRLFVTGSSEEQVVAAVTLLDFVKTLLGDIFEGRQKELAEFRSWANGVYLNFSHFIQSSTNIEEAVPLDYLEALWYRGAALQCASNQPVLDGFLVGYEGDLNKTFDKTNLVMIPWQTKRQIGASDKSTIAGLVCPFIFHDATYYKPNIHLVLSMDLATSSTFGLDPDNGCRLNDCVVSFSMDRSVQDRQWGGYHKDSGKEAMRFCIAIRGHKPSTYPVIRYLNGDQASFGSLFSLTAADLADEDSLASLARWNTTNMQHTVME